MDFGIVDFSYERNSLWGEQMTGAYVANSNDEVEQTTSDIQLQSRYRVTGTGFNY